MGAPSLKSAGPINGPGNPARLLVVDDEFSILTHLGQFLSGKGFNVMLASDGKEALDIFRKRSVDLILSDVKMPGINGVQLLKAVKDVNPRIPVILISGYRDVNTVVDALKAGAENFLTKPLNMDELVSVVERSLNLSCIRLVTSEHFLQLEQTTTMEVPSQSEWICEVINQISLSAVAVGFAQYDLDNNIKLALIEAVTNAMEHGNRWDINKNVTIELVSKPNELQVKVCDQGKGFNHSGVPDPTDEVNLMCERGRGIFLMRAIMDEISYQEPGNCLTLIKRKTHLPEVA
jgi:YesN/AraC family two-component response regulator